MKVMKKTGGLLVFVFVVALSAPATGMAGVVSSAESADKIEVSYADLDLAKSAGLATLYERLKAAAKQACGPQTFKDAGSLKRLQQNQSCYNDLLGRAVAKLENRNLTAMHSG